MKYLFFLLFAAVSTGQLFRLDLGTGVTIYPFDLVIGALLLYFLLRNWRSIKDWDKETIVKPLKIFGLIGIISLLLNPLNLTTFEILNSGLYLIRFFLYASLFFVTLDSLKKKTISVRQLLNGLLVVGVVTSVLGFVQLFLYPNIRNISYLGWDPHFGRLVSVHLDPNFTGLILFFTLILALALLHKKTQLANRYLVITSLILGFPALIFTWSRSSYLAFAIGSFLVFFKNKSLKIFFLVIIVFVVSVIAIPKPTGEGGNLARQSTTNARIANWGKSLELFSKQPILGYGFNTMRFLNVKTGVISQEDLNLNHSAGGLDNSFLFVLATTGIVGFISYLWLLKTIVIEEYKGFKKFKEIKIAFFASFLALMVHSLFQNSLFYPINLIWIWILLAVVSFLRKQESIK